MPSISRFPAFVLVSIACVLGGCSWEVARPAPTDRIASRGPSSGHVGVGRTVADTAHAMLGVPYKWGGQSPDGFDCSGLVYYAYAKQGVQLPRTAALQMDLAQPIALSQARPGDLVFFESSAKGGHVGILIDADHFIHAPSTGKQVAIEGLASPWYRERLIRAGRIPGQH